MNHMMEAVADFKRLYLAHMLAAHGGNKSAMARTLDTQRSYVCRMLRDFGLGGHPSAPKGTAP